METEKWVLLMADKLELPREKRCEDEPANVVSSIEQHRAT